MYAIKGGWAGQAFAMAKCNDNEGKKSRVRRSKEERKEMVVSFIRKYQNLNGGSFPSLNHTHKEVGGSFYIVREIVREIIQENKILGSGNHNGKNLLEDFPLGTIAMEPEETLHESTCKSSFTAARHQFLKEDNELFGSVIVSEKDNLVVNGIDANFVSLEVKKKYESSDDVESEKDGVRWVHNQVESSKNVVGDDIYDTYPDLCNEMSPSDKNMAEHVDMKVVSVSGEGGPLTSSLHENIEKSFIHNTSYLSDQVMEESATVDEINVNNSNVKEDVTESIAAECDGTENLIESSIQTSTIDPFRQENNHISEALNTTKSSNSNLESISTSEISKDVHLQDETEETNESIDETSKLKLDRIHIETWQDSSEKNIHPLLAIFNSFVAFLMKLFP